MLSVATAHALTEAGLDWSPAPFDFFAIPNMGLDERIFVISEMPAAIAQIQGRSMVTFDGAVEWALDYVATGDVLWLPTEEQLRTLLAARLGPELHSALTLVTTPDRCRCDIRWQGRALSCEAADGSEAYAAALLELLRSPAG
jgi:hypothetical protein